jgi:hypothetical protein
MKGKKFTITEAAKRLGISRAAVLSKKIDDHARPLPLINPALFRVARFPRIGLVDARPFFSCPLLKNFPPVRCMFNTDTYFHKRLDHRTTETGFL